MTSHTIMLYFMCIIFGFVVDRVNSLVSASSDQYFTVVVSFDSENIPSLSVEVMVSARYNVLSC